MSSIQPLKVTVITACFNSEKHIRDCLNSVAGQSFKNIEHIIIDGGSSDNTIEVVKSFPSVTKWISEPDNGIYNAMNKGINLAGGDIIGILNSDDFYYDEFVIERIVKEFKKDNDLDAVHTNLYYVKNENTNINVRLWKTGEFKAGSFFKGWHPAHPTLFLKREVYKKYGLFDENFKLAADFEFMLRIFERYKIKSKYLPIETVKMRLGGATNKNLSNIIMGNKECLKAFSNNNFKTPALYPFYRILPKLRQFIIK